MAKLLIKICAILLRLLSMFLFIMAGMSCIAGVRWTAAGFYSAKMGGGIRVPNTGLFICMIAIEVIVGCVFYWISIKLLRSYRNHSKNDLLAGIGRWLPFVIPVSVIVAVLLMVAIQSFRSINQIEKLCSNFPVGADSTSFVQKAYDTHAERIMFWDPETKVSGQTWTNQVDANQIWLLNEKFSSMENGKAFALSMPLYYFRTSCNIEFKDRKITSSLVRNYD